MQNISLLSPERFAVDAARCVAGLRSGSSARTQTAALRVGVLGFDGVSIRDLTSVLDAFATAQAQDKTQTCYAPLIIGVTGDGFIASGGTAMKADCSIASVLDVDTLVIPGGCGMANSTTCRCIADWLLRNEGELRRIACVSAGVYPLAQSGLLQGRRVTTHWRIAPHVASTFPQLAVDNCGSFIRDGKFYTCGGGTAAVEMSLALIQEDYGALAAVHVARELVVNLTPAGTTQLSPAVDHVGVEERLAELPAFITSRLGTKLSLPVLSRRACLCPRHFSRVFQRTFQTSPMEFVEQLRMDEAARRLALRHSAIAEVAEAVGYKSALAFRRAFARRFGVTPRTFRSRRVLHGASRPREELGRGERLQAHYTLEA